LAALGRLRIFQNLRAQPATPSAGRNQNEEQMTENYPPVPGKLETSAGSAVGGTTYGEPYYPSTPSPGTSGQGGKGGQGQPGGPGFNRQQFMRSYANMVAQTWIDPNYMQLLLADPVNTLAAAGLPTADGAVIRIIQVKITGMGRVEDQVDAWVEAARTGLYDLWLPIKPDDVDVSVGGGDPGGCAGGASCCCTPCCCCGS